jgi:hypothetical protein
MEICNCESWEVIIWYGGCGLCGEVILRCKCRIVNWKYVTVEVGKSKFDIADVMCVMRGYWAVNVELLNGNM